MDWPSGGRIERPQIKSRDRRAGKLEVVYRRGWKADWRDICRDFERVGESENMRMNRQTDLNTEWQAEWRMDERVGWYMLRLDVRWVSG